MTLLVTLTIYLIYLFYLLTSTDIVRGYKGLSQHYRRLPLDDLASLVTRLLEVT